MAKRTIGVVQYDILGMGHHKVSWILSDKSKPYEERLKQADELRSEGGYIVATAQNTTDPMCGQWLSVAEVDSLIAQGYVVNIRLPKESS